LKKYRLSLIPQATVLLGALALGIGCGGSSHKTTATGTYDSSLKFDTTDYETITVTVDGTDMAVRKYGPITYVANPVAMATTQSGGMGSTTLSTGNEMQQMYIYVPETSASNQKTALWMRFNNAGWMFSVVSDALSDGATLTSSDSTPMAYALKAGYIIASVGTRGRGAVADDGTYAGKAPACIVDAKAAIRYMKLNDSIMPGSAERIIICGTSGGGGQVTAVGASGDSSDYYSYLAEVGAAGITGSGSSATSTISDSVFAVQAYCPINNLGRADEGYEWQYNAIRSGSATYYTASDHSASATATFTGSLAGVAYADGPQPAASAEIASSWPTYLSGLGLKMEDGSTTLTASEMKNAIVALMTEEINLQLGKGVSIPDYGEDFVYASAGGPPGSTATTKYIPNNWLTLSSDGTKVASLDYTNFLKFVATLSQLKTVVAFDACGVTGNTSVSGESNLYGASTVSYSNFMEWAWNNNQIVGDYSGLNDTGYTWVQYMATSAGATLAKQVKMTSPIPYLATAKASTPAPYWYVRHGMVDRDTSFAIQTLLYYAIKNNSSVKDLDFRFPYLTGHGGDYDASEAFTWISEKLAAAN